MKTRVRTRCTGMTLVMVTTIGVIVGILGMSMVELGYHARILSVRNVQRISARTAADAGLADGLFWMQRKLVNWQNDKLANPALAWYEGDLPRKITAALPGTNAQFTYTISILEACKRYQIDSTGTCGGQTGQSKAVHGIVVVGSRLKGVGVQESLTVMVNATFDTYPPDATSQIQLLSNTTDKQKPMVFNNGVQVYGDVFCGPCDEQTADDVIVTRKSAYIHGDDGANSEILEFPPVAAPTGTVYDPTHPIITTSQTITGGAFRYDTIDLGKGGVLTISGPTTLYVTGKMILGNSAQVIIQSPNGSLNLYLGTSLEEKQGSASLGFTNESGDPSNLKIYGLPTCTWIDLKASSDTRAAVYAPSAVVNLFNSGTFYGAITGKSFVMKNSGTFWFDTRLTRTIIDDAAAAFVIDRWWEG